MKKYDIIIMGAGIGLTIAEAAIGNKMTCAIIEPSRFGGTCLTKGCIPSKVLTTAADYIRQAKVAEKTGVVCEIKEIDISKIIKRMQNRIDLSNQIEKSLNNEEGIDIFRGYGEFTGDKTLKVRYSDGKFSEEITSDTIVVCIGARSFVPDIKGLEKTGYITSETFFADRKIDNKIKSWKEVVIVGSGAIGLEFAHFFSAVGIDITIVEIKDRILPAEEPDISEFVRINMEKKGIRVITGSAISEINKENGKKRFALKKHNEDFVEENIYADEIFIAAGLKSNSDIAKLKNTGVKMDQSGWVETDGYLRTSVPGIWALGDINGKYQFRHKANYEGEICVHNIFNGKKGMKKAGYDSVPWAVFSDPQVAHVGMTLKQALEKRRGVYVGTKKYSSIAKGYAMGYEENDPDDGFVRLITDENFRILGAHITGPEASVLIQSYVYLMNSGCSCVVSEKNYSRVSDERCKDFGTVKPIGDSMVIHPALSELTAWVVSEMQWEES